MKEGSRWARSYAASTEFGGRYPEFYAAKSGTQLTDGAVIEDWTSPKRFVGPTPATHAILPQLKARETVYQADKLHSLYLKVENPKNPEDTL